MGMKAVPSVEEASPELVHEAMLLMVPRYFWDVLTLQAQSEGVAPGMVLDKALRMYLEAKGCDGAVKKLWDVAGLACGRQKA